MEDLLLATFKPPYATRIARTKIMTINQAESSSIVSSVTGTMKSNGSISPPLAMNVDSSPISTETRNLGSFIDVSLIWKIASTV